MKTKLKFISIKILTLFVISSIYSGIVSMIAMVISNRFGYQLQDVLTYAGLLLLLIGILMSLKGTPSGMFNGIGSKDASYTSYINNEFTSLEREINPYYKNYLKNNIVCFTYSNLTFIIGGLLILALIVVVYY